MTDNDWLLGVADKLCKLADIIADELMACNKAGIQVNAEAMIRRITPILDGLSDKMKSYRISTGH
jgi:hypothetical protein